MRNDWWNDAELVTGRTAEQIYSAAFALGFKDRVDGKPEQEEPSHEGWLDGWNAAGGE